MSNYITVENQTVLWKTIQKIPQFNNNALSMNREKWFSNIIKHFYEQIQSPKISVSELKILNQQTIAYMIQDLKRIDSMRTAPVSASQTSSPVNTGLSPAQVPRSGDALLPSYETPQSRMSMYNEQFNARQQEYSNMAKPPAPLKSFDFSEKIEDEVITNMDELLQQQIKQREYDISQTKLPPSLPNAIPMSPQNTNISPQPSTELNMAKTPGSSITVDSHSSDVFVSGDDKSSSINIQHVLEELKLQLAELREEVKLLKQQNHSLHTSSKTSIERGTSVSDSL
jgi:hypothetical protein